MLFSMLLKVPHTSITLFKDLLQIQNATMIPRVRFLLLFSLNCYQILVITLNSCYCHTVVHCLLYSLSLSLALVEHSQPSKSSPLPPCRYCVQLHCYDCMNKFDNQIRFEQNKNGSSLKCVLPPPPTIDIRQIIIDHTSSNARHKFMIINLLESGNFFLVCTFDNSEISSCFWVKKK